MAGAGYKLFNTGDVLTAAQVNTYLQEQAVMVFADATARTTALSGVLAEGMVSYLKDTNATEVYDGSAWVGIGNSGDITGVTAGTGISGGGTSGTVTITNDMATTITAAGDIVVGTGSGTYDNLPIGTTGQVLTADTTVSPYKVKWAAASSGAMTQLADTTLSSAAADITFSSISSSYNHLLVLISGRCTATDNNTDMQVRLNGDTGNNYISSRNSTYAGSGSTVTISGNSGVSSMLLGNIWVGNAQADSVSAIQMFFYDYKNTTLQKTMTFTGGSYSDAPGVGSGWNRWKNTNAVTSIKLFSGSGNFAIGTRATLYGLV